VLNNGAENAVAINAAVDARAVEDDESLEAMDEDEDGDEDDSNPMAALLASAQARATKYQGNERHDVMDEDEEDDGDSGITLPTSEGPSIDYKNPDSSRSAFDKIFKQVLEAADVILYVLDARDPEGTRSQEVERQITAAENGAKRLILVLNKIDLVPPPALKAWLVHLGRYFPTIPLRASTPASNARTFDHKQLTVRGTSETLLRALKAYGASAQMKRSISVGVIGYPNVGKSSVINALTSRLNKGNQNSACPVGSEAGVTTSLREVKVDNKLKVLDSPGIVFPSETTKSNAETGRIANDEARLILLNALPPKHISDPVPAVSLLLSRLCSSPGLYEKLLQTYSITALGPFGNGDTTTDFLVQVARKRGRIGKGGIPNLNAAAMAVITDWRDGRIQGWMEAPTLQVAGDAETNAEDDIKPGSLAPDRKEIVKEWAQEFKLEGLWGDGPQDEEAMQQ
jgi:nuclear GTP-binding protein